MGGKLVNMLPIQFGKQSLKGVNLAQNYGLTPARYILPWLATKRRPHPVLIHVLFWTPLSRTQYRHGTDYHLITTTKSSIFSLTQYASWTYCTIIHLFLKVQVIGLYKVHCHYKPSRVHMYVWKHDTPELRYKEYKDF